MKKNYKKRNKSVKPVSNVKRKSKKKESIKEKVDRFLYTSEFFKSRDSKEDLKSKNQDINSKKGNPTKKISSISITPTVKKRKTWRIVLLILICIISIIGICLLIFFIPYISIAYDSYNNGFDTTRIDIDRVPHIYDKDGNLLAIMYGYYDSGEENFIPTYSSVYTDISSLPKYISDAFTAIEDETFYDNNGISINRLLYATFNYVVHGDSSFGGSTITQQLVKVATGDNAHSPSRKAREIGSALYLTDNWSKSKILASYINLVYYGNNAYGIYEASMTYFNTEPKNLNIAQAAIIASIPNSPEKLNPYGTDANRTQLFNRQKLVLKKMLELKLITDKEYTEALNYKIEFSNGSSRIIKNNPAINPYLKIAFDQAIDVVKETYSCSNKEAIDKILNGNTKIYLNLDVNMQNKVYEIAKSNFTEHPNLELGGVVSTKDGKVLAVISSRTDSNIDHAYYMTRQTGSAIKPLSVYGPAYDMGILTPTSIVQDIPTSIQTSSGTWNVNNASRKYSGSMTTNQAIANSLNTVAVRTLQQVGLEKSYNYLTSFGITSLDKTNDMYYPPLALGAFTYGISPYEMTQAYNAISNDGHYSNISTINYIEIDGNNIQKQKNEHQVISTNAASMLKTSLHEVATNGTGRTANISYTTAYLKTGTTNDTKDLWTCGFTNDLTACIWGGYDTPAPIPIYNVNIIWKQIMEYYYTR